MKAFVLFYGIFTVFCGFMAGININETKFFGGFWFWIVLTVINGSSTIWNTYQLIKKAK